MENEEFYVFSGEPMDGDVGPFLQVCKAEEKMVHNSIRRAVARHVVLPWCTGTSKTK
jgi:hypothetical protein